MQRNANPRQTLLRQQSPAGDDILLWNALRNGSKEAFEVIYRKYINDLYNYGMHVFQDSKLVEDAAHDLFVDLWKRRSFLGETDAIRFYLYTALKRNIVRKLKGKEKSTHRYSLDEAANVNHAESAEMEVIALQQSHETSENLNRAIAALPERQREIIIHKFYNNLSSEEISTRMAIGIDSTYTLLSRALHELRKNFKRLYLLLFFSLFF